MKNIIIKLSSCRKRKRGSSSVKSEYSPVVLKINKISDSMRNSPTSKRVKSKPKDVTPTTQPIKVIEIRSPLNVSRLHNSRKFSVSDSNDSTSINSPSSSSDGFTGQSELEEMSMMDLAMEFSTGTHLNNSNNPLITQTIPIEYKFSAHSLPKTSFIKTSGRTNRSTLYSSSLQTSFLPLGSDSPAAPYRGGRRKEPPPPCMTEEQRKQWQKERAKKDSHNKVEKKRRLRINDCITEIGRRLPKDYNTNDEKRKGQILLSTLDFMRDQEGKDHEILRLRMKCDGLEDVNNRYKEILRLLDSLHPHLSNFIQNLIGETTEQRAVKKEQLIINDAASSFRLEDIKEHIDINGNILIPTDFLSENLIFKNEQDDLSLSKKPDLSMEESFDFAESLHELDHHAVYGTPSLPTFSGPENQLHPGYHVGSVDGLNYCNVFLDQFENIFPDIPNEVNSTLDCSPFAMNFTLP